ncbi:hypothetical protein ABPG74_020083 [Tetrahymena malaccensis]
MNFLFIPDIKNHKEDTFFKTWPPLSDENLRKKIIELKNEHIDYNEKIIQFYEQFKKQIDQILSDKMKQQLLDAQKIYDFKDKIIEQYCKLAEIKKLNECLNQENKQTIQIEEDLKQIIDSQFSKINEYTSILSNMMKQYELINQLNFENPNQVKNDIFKILETINVIPQNNFNFSEEADMFSIESIQIYKKKVNKELRIHKNNQSIQNNLMHLLNIFKNQLTFMNYPQFILNNSYFQNFIYISNINNSQNSISAQLNPDKGVYQIFKGNAWQSSQCFIYKTLKANKKYELIIQFNKLKNNSQYYLGLIQSQDINNKYLSNVYLGFDIGYPYVQKQGNTLLIQISIQDKLLQYGGFCKQPIFEKASNSSNINTKHQYYFGIQFNNESGGDIIDIISFNELEEFS